MTHQEQIKALDAYVRVLLWEPDTRCAALAGAAMESTIDDKETLGIALAHLADHAATMVALRYEAALARGGIVQPHIDGAETHAGRIALQIISTAANGNLATSASLINAVAVTTYQGDSPELGGDVYRQLARFARILALALAEGSEL